jgi:hypothetical protein
LMRWHLGSGHSPLTDGNGTMTCPILGAEWERWDTAMRGQKRSPYLAGSR